MKAIVLAGGFAKRLWPLTKDTPKPLLHVGGKPMIDHIMEKLSAVSEIDEIYISTNSKFEPHFNRWISSSSFRKNVSIFAEESHCEEKKLGAIGALGVIFRELDINDDVIVVAGDNLFEFDINDFLRCAHGEVPKVALYDMREKDAVRNRYGVVVLNENNIIKEFHEKPEDPVSTIISTGCYFFPKGTAHKIHEYIANGKNPDAPGFFIEWLSKQTDVSGFVLSENHRWFDIGSIESYEEANRLYSNV
ncbi:MAG: nucleotidyltransferase family protein [Candidatus Aenigmarchaeota archaeon]|nr:nucleotidyltransferase family protein [Candidatus Aenigmarchaeota archaeon]